MQYRRIILSDQLLVLGRRSGHSDCVIRGASHSTASQEICSSPMLDRACLKKSISNQQQARAARTMDGTPWKAAAATSLLVAVIAATSCCPSPNTTMIVAARSPAVSVIAARQYQL